MALLPVAGMAPLPHSECFSRSYQHAGEEAGTPGRQPVQLVTQGAKLSLLPFPALLTGN